MIWVPVVLQQPRLDRVRACGGHTVVSHSQITFKGDGPAQNVLAIANTRGDVKGLIANPLADPPLRPDGKLDVGAAVGRGRWRWQRQRAGVGEERGRSGGGVG